MRLSLETNENRQMTTRAKVSLLAAVPMFLAFSQGILGSEGIAVSRSDSFRTKTIRREAFRLADGSVRPEGKYFLIVRGTGKPGEAALQVHDAASGKEVGMLLGTLSSPQAKKGFDPQPEPPVKFSDLGLGPASEVVVRQKGRMLVLRIAGRTAVIEAELLSPQN